MRDGERLAASPDLTAVRAHAANQLATLPKSMHDPFASSDYPVEISKSLEELAAEIDRSGQQGDQSS